MNLLVCFLLPNLKIMWNAKQLLTELVVCVRVHSVSLYHPVSQMPVVSHNYCNNQKSLHKISNCFIRGRYHPRPPATLLYNRLLEIKSLFYTVKLGGKEKTSRKTCWFYMFSFRINVIGL